MWSSAPASKSCLYGSSFVLRGIIGPLKEVKCRLLVCLLGQDGPRASAEREEGFFPLLNPVTSYLYQALKKPAGEQRARQAQNNAFKRISVMTVCCSEGWHSYSHKPFHKQWERSDGFTAQRLFLSGVLHHSVAQQLGQDPPGDSWEVTKFCKKCEQNIDHNFHKVF